MKETQMAEYKRIPKGVIKVPVPNVQQTTDFACGAAVTQSVCCYFGVGPDDQAEYMRKLKAEPDGGTSPDEIVKFCKSEGLTAKAIENMSIDDLVGYIGKGRPVICAMQAYGTKTDYKKCISGHYLVAIGYDKKNIYFEDPKSTGRRAFVSRDEFSDRWHDYDKYEQEYYHLGIVVWKRGQTVSSNEARKLD
jgi:predicted double-glycine peptidase